MKRYNLINNSLGWLCFVIAAVTYLLTIEPTASFWDCPEFISQGYKLEVGHPPGNPIFMLTARFFVTLFGGGADTAAIAVNSMSALLSAGTILLLFWTITHLVKKLTVKDDTTEISLPKMLVIMGAGLCGALAYTWSDTFWFSAVEGEVYAFSSFCTALVFWLILKWENRADQPHSDRYLVLIAYVIGISIAVHLLNLLCIPAIVLVFYYKKFKNTSVKGSLLALAVSAAIIGLILYGLVPGFISVAQRFELFFVNTLGMSYNTGVLAYVIILLGIFIWTIYELYKQKSVARIKLGVLLSLILSGMPFIGHGWIIPTILILALVCYLYVFCKKIPTRIFNVMILSVFVIFIGYSSYALLLIRASANTPMNQNAPDNVFALASYLNREQYGDRPLFYGSSFAERIKWEKAYVNNPETGEPVLIEYTNVDAQGYPVLSSIDGYVRKDGVVVDEGEDAYTKIAKKNDNEPDRYVKERHNTKPKTSEDMDMLFTRIYSTRADHVNNYKSWTDYTVEDFENIPSSVRSEWAMRPEHIVTREELLPYLKNTSTVNLGDETVSDVYKPGFMTNLKYFVGYQLNHMYWRYFMWNFAGRQNDYAGNGEPHMGNWISGIPALDNARLGDQSLLPDQYGKDNPGHNVFYMLPLLMGIFGLLWQALKRHKYYPNRGIEQFWIVFFLFFMTGIAIVLYLNQTPGQPRERDYAFAGSFYAFAIWIGMGVPAIASFIRMALGHLQNKDADAEDDSEVEVNAPTAGVKNVSGKAPAKNHPTQALPRNIQIVAASVAVLIGILIPLQMVSQTWDDHDRSGRYTARDFGMNYLYSLDDDAIIFVNGDNDTFPLWYAQEVEGCRPDVKVVNLSYLSTDWYANQISAATYDAAGVPMFARPTDYAYDKLQFINYPAANLYELIASELEQALASEQLETVQYARKLGEPLTWETVQKYKDLAEDTRNLSPVTIDEAMKEFYSHTNPGHDVIKAIWDVDYSFTRPDVIVPLDEKAIKKHFGSMGNISYLDGKPYMKMGIDQLKEFNGLLSEWLRFDIIAKSAMNNFKRPVYFASTVGPSYYLGLDNNLVNTGMALQVTPFTDGATPATSAKAYCNIIDKFRWGGIDAKDHKPYLDETVRNMVSSTRLAMIDAAEEMIGLGDNPAPADVRTISAKKGLHVPANYYEMAANILDYMQQKLPADVAPYESGLDVRLAQTYTSLGLMTGNKAYLNKARNIANYVVDHYAPVMKYAASLSDRQRSLLGNATKYDVKYNLTTATGILNIVNLAEKIMAMPDVPADSEDDYTNVEKLSMLAYLNSHQSYIPLFQEMFLHNDSGRFDTVVKQFYESDPQTAMQMHYVIALMEDLGLDRNAIAKQLAKKAGLSVSQWLNLSDI